jgi:hypothetical protein
MSESEKVRRDKQVMVRLNESEYAQLLGAATGADRKVADMVRVLMLRGLRADRLESEDAA